MAEAGRVISHLFDQPTEALKGLARKSEIWSYRKAAELAGLPQGPRRRSFHWGLGPVLADFQPAFLRQGLDRFLGGPVELFSFDLGPAAERHQGILPLAPPLSRDQIMRSSEKAVNFIRRFYPGPLAAENYNFYPTGLYGQVTEPDFIHNYLRELGLGLVLDLAHGAVSAHNTGRDPEEYFQALPLELVREIHISRPWLPDEPHLAAVDEHERPGPREWRWLAGLLETGRLPESTVVYIEYYRDLSKLIEAQAYLGRLLAGQNGASEKFTRPGL